MLLLLPSHFSRAQLCATPQTAAYQAHPSLGFSRQDLLCGTGKFTQYSVMAYMGKLSVRVDMYMTDSLCCALETNTTCKLTILQ